MTMKAPRYAVSRRKACQECFDAKTKCDRVADLSGCHRCRSRNVHCSYEKKEVTASQKASVSADRAVKHPTPNNGTGRLATRALIDLEEASRAEGNAGAPDADRRPEFSDLRLICPINANDISNRWLNSYIPNPQQKPKVYPSSVTAFIHRILNSYVGMAIRRRAPPFIHQAQLLPSAISEPLATCFGVVRMFEEPLPGSEAPLTSVLEREMSKLYEWRGMYDNATLLAAFQAYLIYAMLLFFRWTESSTALLRQAMMSLQELACASARQGLVCVEEPQHARPSWESWIIAEAKRRTLYTMCLFDSLLLAKSDLPTFIASEVHGLSAPGSKALWASQSRGVWEREYNLLLAVWPQGHLRIDELWPIPTDLDKTGVANRRDRVDQWLEHVDEYGTMMYAVTSCTHGV